MSIAPALAALEDRALVRRVRHGDPRAFEAIDARYRSALVRYAEARLGTRRTAAEDVVQDALWRTFRVLREHDGELELRPWLFTVVRHRVVDELRRSAAVELAPDALERAGGGRDPAAVVLCREELGAVVHDVAALPGRQRRALVGHVLDGRTHADVACELRTSETASKMLVNRARRRLGAAARNRLTGDDAGGLRAAAGT